MLPVHARLCSRAYRWTCATAPAREQTHQGVPTLRKLIPILATVALVVGLALPVAASTFYPPTANGQWAAYPGQSTTFGAAVQQPINTDGSSNFKANGKTVIPVKFALSQGSGAFVFESIGSDTGTANDFSVLQWASNTSFTFRQLTTLIANYNFTTGDCFGGSLRWDVEVAGGPGVVRFHYGNPNGPDQGCSGSNSWSGQNIISGGIVDNRIELGNGGPYTNYAAALAATNDGQMAVTGIQLTLDSGWKGDQRVTLTSATVAVGNGATTPYTDTWTPLPSSPPTPTCPTAEAQFSMTKVDGAPTGDINEPLSIQPQDSNLLYRIVDCKYMYNLATSSMSGVGTYTVKATIGSTTFTVATFDLK
jgi:hypothetical protein